MRLHDLLSLQLGRTDLRLMDFQRDAPAVPELEPEERTDADLEVKAVTDLQRQTEQRRLDARGVLRAEDLLHENAVRPAQSPREAQHAAEYRAAPCPASESSPSPRGT